jgi:pyruvate kinase
VIYKVLSYGLSDGRRRSGACDLITFTTAEDILGTAQKVFMKYQNFPNDVNPERILLDDGKLIFEIVETDKNQRSLQESFKVN